MQRRTFLCSVGTATAIPVALNSSLGAAISTGEPLPRFDPANETVRGEMRYRKLGKTGETVSCIGLGGHHIGRIADETECTRLIRSAIDSGINFMDNCWDYHDGLSELRMGKALQDGYRKRVFLMTKIDGRTAAEAARQIDQSLLRLRTDMIDLIQFHEMLRMEDADRIFAEDGGMAAMQAAKKAGKVRFVGFTGHKDPAVHLRTLDVAGEHDFHFDTAQMPLNVMDAHFRSFARNVVPVLLRQEIGVLGMKSMADGGILKSKSVTAVECLQYALSLPTSVVITGIESQERLKQALDVAKGFKPFTQEQIDALLEKTRHDAARGQFEGFKTGVKFDSTAKHPEWLG